MTMVRATYPRPAYRVQQFLHALLAMLLPISAADIAQARAFLPAAAWPLFLGMSRGDQRHSLNVLAALRAAGEPRPALAQAALLHDCAKHGAGVRLWHRVAVVLLKAFAPGLLARWGQAEPAAGSWRYPFWAHVNHPQRGADLAAAAGCDPLAVLLIARHQEPRAAGAGDIDRLLAALQTADDDN
jgi:hypothetical protein